MKKPRLLDPQLGKNAKIDPQVTLNALTGRKLIKVHPLQVGNNARIRSGSVLYAGTRLGHHFESGHNVIVREENQIGNYVSIWNNTTVDYGCRIGHRVKIHANCYIAQYSTLEDDVFLAPGVTFANDPFPGSPYAARVLQGPSIGKGAQIGVNCTILPGVHIGKGALIGAGSVVTRDVPDYRVVWGNPARVHKKRGELEWPKDYPLTRTPERSFYRKKLAGRPVFSKDQL